MKNNDSKFKKILKATRRWAESLADKHYYLYTNDLQGLCAITSKELFYRLTAEGFNCKIAYNSNHCFILYKNRVVDLTASQFGKPKIYIFSIKDNQLGYWKIEKTFTDIEDLSEYQEEKGWYQHQICLQ